MAPKWFDHWTTWAGLQFGVTCTLLLSSLQGSVCRGGGCRSLLVPGGILLDVRPSSRSARQAQDVHTGAITIDLLLPAWLGFVNLVLSLLRDARRGVVQCAACIVGCDVDVDVGRIYERWLRPLCPPHLINQSINQSVFV